MNVKRPVTIIISFCLFCVSAPVFAEILIMKDGRILNEEVVQKDAHFVITMKGGAPNRYALGQIERIEDDIKLGERIIDVTQFKDSTVDEVRLIIQYMEVSGIRNIMQQNVGQVINDAPAESQEILRKLFDTDEIIERLIPVYDKYYTREELQALVAFYNGPVGRKVLEVTPLIMQETVAASMQYIQDKMGK